jgi:hypothetical protein
VTYRERTHQMMLSFWAQLGLILLMFALVIFAAPPFIWLLTLWGRWWLM